MSSEEVKFTRSKARKKNIMAKVLHDPGDHKGAYGLRIIDSRKEEYRRRKMRINEIDYEEDD